MPVSITLNLHFYQSYKFKVVHSILTRHIKIKVFIFTPANRSLMVNRAFLSIGLHVAPFNDLRVSERKNTFIYDQCTTPITLFLCSFTRIEMNVG